MKIKKPRLVFLDAGTVNYGDLSLWPLEQIGRLTVYHHTSQRQTAERLHRAHVAITNKCILDRKILSSLKDLRLVALTATGMNNVDLEAAAEYGIAIRNVPGYSTQTVAQNTMALILALAGSLVKYNEAAHDGRWSRSPFFVYGAYPIQELRGKKLGIIGYGAIGRKVGEMAEAFGMKLLVARIPGQHYPHGRGGPRRVSFERMVRRSDFVTIHAPLSNQTRDLINARILRKMKPSAFLLNMARGGIVNERALYHALKTGRLAGAALDVLAQEPPPQHHILLGAPNLLLTPHVSWASLEVRTRLIKQVAQNINKFLRGGCA